MLLRRSRLWVIALGSWSPSAVNGLRMVSRSSVLWYTQRALGYCSIKWGWGGWEMFARSSKSRLPLQQTNLLMLERQGHPSVPGQTVLCGESLGDVAGVIGADDIMLLGGGLCGHKIIQQGEVLCRILLECLWT